MDIKEALKQLKLNEDIQKPFNFEFIWKLPKIISRDPGNVQFTYMGIEETFDTLKEAKEYFMEDIIMKIQVNDCAKTWDELRHYCDEPEDDERDLIDSWENWVEELASDNYIDMEFYRGPFTGIRRMYKALSSYIKGDIELELFLYAHRMFMLDKQKEDFTANCFTDEGLRLAGLMDDPQEDIDVYIRQ